ncbi:MAG: AAA-like domain-containing protein [Acidobacteria bacterium]|nr:AAA-like domain-containing protein [Acidobacteriota bacterium]
MAISLSSFYVIGGTLHYDAMCYVERQADSRLIEGLKIGKFCYVLTSRQMGKSSLMVRTAIRLRNEGFRVAVLDLTAIGQNLNAEQWYNGILNQIGQQLDLEDELDDFWQAHKQLGPLQRWMKAVHKIVLTNKNNQFIIFIDEIDIVKSLPFSVDEFFAGIRKFYNQRAEDSELNRLTFCLLGVATPSDLIRDTRITPFNIGQRIELGDFTESEAYSLIRGLMREEKIAAQLLKQVLYWTNGHPYLTQRICQAIALDASIIDSIGVDKICNELFFSYRAKEKDDNLLFVRERILKSEVELASLLNLYKQVHKEKKIKDDETNPLVSILQLSGIAKVENAYLVVRNKIYKQVFNQTWIELHMPYAEARRRRAAVRKSVLLTASISLIILSIIFSLAFVAIKQRNEALEQKNKLQKQVFVTRQLNYIANLRLVQNAWDEGKIERVLELLNSQIPKLGEEDLREFEWYYFWKLSHPDLVTFKGHTNGVNSIAFSPDGKFLASGSSDKTIKLWDITSSKVLAVFQGHTSGVISIAFSPDGKFLASGSSDKTIKLWDITLNKLLFTLNSHTGEISMVAFSPNGQLLASSSWDKTIKLWDLASNKVLATLPGSNDLGGSIAFSPDGKILAGVSIDQSIKLWDIASNKVLATLKGHKGEILSLAFSPDGNLLASGSLADECVKIWDIKSKKEITTLKQYPGKISLAFSPNGKLLAIASWKDKVVLWDRVAKKELAILKNFANTTYSIMFSPDGKLLASGNSDKTIKFWDINTKENITVVKEQPNYNSLTKISPDGKFLASTKDNTIKLWDLASNQLLNTFTGHSNKIESLAFSLNGNLLASTSIDKTVKLWDLTTNQQLVTFNYNKEVKLVTFSPDEKLLAISSSDNTIKLWNLITRKELITFNGHSASVLAIEFSPDGKFLATGSADNTVKLWDVEAKKEKRELKGCNYLVRALAFSPNNKSLLAAGDGDIMNLWDVETGQEIARLKDTALKVKNMSRK